MARSLESTTLSIELKEVQKLVFGRAIQNMDSEMNLGNYFVSYCVLIQLLVNFLKHREHPTCKTNPCLELCPEILLF